MKTLILFVCFFLMIAGVVNAQYPRYNRRGRYQTRPQYQSYYNGWGIQPGYSYNPRNGWNRIERPGGGFSYRDGYIPPFQGYYNGYGYSGNTYSSVINGMVYPG